MKLFMKSTWLCTTFRDHVTVTVTTQRLHFCCIKAFGAVKSQLFGVRVACTRAKKHAHELPMKQLFLACSSMVVRVGFSLLLWETKTWHFMGVASALCTGSPLVQWERKHTSFDLEKLLRVSGLLRIFEPDRLQWIDTEYLVTWYY